jgi:WD40 repeat protein
MWDFHNDKIRSIPVQWTSERSIIVSGNSEKIATSVYEGESDPLAFLLENEGVSENPSLKYKSPLKRNYASIIKVWNYSDGSLLQTLEGHTKDVTSMAFSPDGNYLLSGSDDNSIRLWDTFSGNLVYRFEKPNTYIPDSFSRSTINVSFSPDGKQFAMVSLDGSIHVWAIGQE